LLAGRPLLRESDPYRALDRVQHEDLVLPASVAVDDGLRGIVARALARDLHQRYDGVAAMRAALAAWLEPDAAVATPTASHGTLEFLLRRMRNKGDFPALSESVGRIQRIANSETESLSSLAGEILHDVALTNKLLRMVNSAHFNTGAGAVSTVSRAVALVGFAGIRNMALSLLLLEHMRDQGHAAFLKDEFLRALMAGMLASELSSTTREGEEAFLGSMFQNLGRLLTEYYFPEEAQQIRRQLGDAKAGTQERDKAASRVLGIGFEELGCAVARSWSLPDNLQRSMRAPAGAVPARGAALGIERQRWLGRAGNEISDLLLDAEGEALERQLGATAERFGAVLGMAPRAIVEGVGRARAELGRMMPAMGLRLGPHAAARRLVAPAPAPADASPPQRTLVAPRADEAATLVAPHPEAAATLVLPQRSEAADLLAAGVQDITNTMVDESFRIDEVLRKVLETMLRALAFRRVIFCLRDPRTESLTGRFGLGAGAKELSPRFKVPLRAAPESDLFTAVCVKAVDTLIADAAARNIAGRVPAWYRAAANAPTFLLLPMLRKGQPFALIYADKAEAGAIQLQDREMALLGTLRNQAVMAFRQGELRGA
ncbi:MAG: HDOD domain-containing protein, partial [Burkholderiales bacterium]|nr:HDOD domain-containing protein [Burkholderiales bacterium]